MVVMHLSLETVFIILIILLLSSPCCFVVLCTLTYLCLLFICCRSPYFRVQIKGCKPSLLSAWCIQQHAYNNELRIRTTTKVVRRKRIIHPTGFGTYSLDQLYCQEVILISEVQIPSYRWKFNISWPLFKLKKVSLCLNVIVSETLSPYPNGMIKKSLSHNMENMESASQVHQRGVVLHQQTMNVEQFSIIRWQWCYSTPPIDKYKKI